MKPVVWPLVLLVSYLALVSAAGTLAGASSNNLPFKVNKSTPEGDRDYIPPIFPILPFEKYAHNPILTPNPSNEWESAYVYNPTAIVLNDTVFLLYRAQNPSKTSSIGLAWSTDGVNFTRLDTPIIYPTEPWEAGGGTEDPRLVRVNGTFYLTYTAWDLDAPQLCMTTSEDLLTWTKYPPLFPGFEDVAISGDGEYVLRVNHTKSGAIVAEPSPDGLYHMYFGDSLFYHATSIDLLHWTASAEPFATPMNPWEDGLIEPGATPIKTRDGRWLLIYNGMATGKAGYRPTQYSVGQMLLDPSDSYRPPSAQQHHHTSQQPAGGSSRSPHAHVYGTDERSRNHYHRNGQQRPLSDGANVPSSPDTAYERPIARLETPFLVPTTAEEEKGQVDLVVFAEGLVQFRRKWFLYYGQADQTLGVAVADVQA